MGRLVPTRSLHKGRDSPDCAGPAACSESGQMFSWPGGISISSLVGIQGILRAGRDRLLLPHSHTPTSMPVSLPPVPLSMLPLCIWPSSYHRPCSRCWWQHDTSETSLCLYHLLGAKEQTGFYLLKGPERLLCPYPFKRNWEEPVVPPRGRKCPDKRAVVLSAQLIFTSTGAQTSIFPLAQLCHGCGHPQPSALEPSSALPPLVT